MTNTLTERLEAIEREILQQDETWHRTRDALARLGSVELAVPRDVLSFLVGSFRPPVAGSLRG
jgi:hypothetical protein